MHVVGIRVKPDDLSKEMAAMRLWLDEHRIDLSTFTCRHNDDGMLVHVELRLAHQAAAFAERFGGRPNRPLLAYAEEDLVQEASPAGALVG
jgi:hypothetical protein